jgi:outer membrane protein assembly factor BamB
MRTLLASLALSLLASAASAGDWPQILGLHRNGVADDERIVDGFPAGGPKPLWTRPVGEGFAGVAVRDGQVALFHRVDDSERLELLEGRTGAPVWQSDKPAGYAGGVASDTGPRCVPIVKKDRVIVFGAEGLLRCIDRKTGKELWSDPTRETFGVPESYFGAGSSPLIEGDLVLVNVGGARQNAGVVAFDLKTGDVKWKATGEQASYSSPVVATLGGKRQAIFVTRLACVGLDPATGKVLWSFPFGARGPTVNAANPVLLGDRLFLTASYGVGAVFRKVSAAKAEELWSNGDLLSSQYTTPIEHEGVLYGIDGRQDVGDAALRCIDPATQKVLWSQDGFGYATLIKADGKLLVQKTDGTLVLVRPGKTGYRELAQASLTQGTARPLPALSNGLYFVRDEETLYCYDLSRPE